MKNNASKGMTLIELVITMVILGVGLSGILSVMIVIARNSVSPQISWQAVMLGESALEILMSKSYDLSPVCMPKSNESNFESLCDYASIKDAKLATVFPELMKNLKDYPMFTISIDIEPYHGEHKEIESALININIKHDQIGETHFAAVKTKESVGNEKGKRFYAY